MQRSLTQEEEADPTQPFTHTSVGDQLIVSFESLTALSAIENHVHGKEGAQLKRVRPFSRPQKMKNQNKKKDTKNKRNKTAASGGRRDLQAHRHRHARLGLDDPLQFQEVPRGRPVRDRRRAVRRDPGVRPLERRGRWRRRQLVGVCGISFIWHLSVVGGISVFLTNLY